MKTNNVVKKSKEIIPLPFEIAKHLDPYECMISVEMFEKEQRLREALYRRKMERKAQK